ncbi:Rap1a/Tai family immunity protein [Methylobacterium segetis]|uniref:Rap1a/Tai family immunity protein n=1 Tax=Methylobacterium segetis TaxID=2488750 RepID=UPI001048A739|nr:Rap1a/Tai family immunity protein [Methylobacterium segetis]
MMRRLALALMLAWVPDHAYAFYLTGIRLQELCSQKNISAELDSMLNVYMMGIVDSTAPAAEEVRPFCVPDGVSAKQVKEAVCKHLTDHPEGRRHRAGDLAATALLKAWPCR